MSQTSFVAQSILATGPIIVGRDVGSLGACAELSADQVRTLLGVLTSAEIAAAYAPLSHNHDEYLPLNPLTIQFGGITNAFPMLKRNTTSLEARLADDSAFANISAATGRFSTLSVSGATGAVQFNATANSILYLGLNGGLQFGWSSTGSFALGSAGTINWSSNSNYNGAADVSLVRNSTSQIDIRADSGARFRSVANNSFSDVQLGTLTANGWVSVGPNGVLPITNGTGLIGSNAQLMSDINHRGTALNYNAGFSGTANYERGYQRWNANVYEIGTENAGTGVARNMRLSPSGGALIVNGNLGIGITPTAPLHIEQSFPVVNYAIGPYVAWKNTFNSSSQGHCNFRLDTTHASASTGFVFANGGVAKFDWLIYGSPANKVIRESQNGSATALHLLAGTGLGVGKSPTCRLDVGGDAKISGVTYLGSYTIASLPPAASSATAFATVSNSTPPNLLVQASGGAWRYVHDNSAV